MMPPHTLPTLTAVLALLLGAGCLLWSEAVATAPGQSYASPNVHVHIARRTSRAREGPPQPIAAARSRRAAGHESPERARGRGALPHTASPHAFQAPLPSNSHTAAQGAASRFTFAGGSQWPGADRGRVAGTAPPRAHTPQRRWPTVPLRWVCLATAALATVAAAVARRRSAAEARLPPPPLGPELRRTEVGPAHAPCRGDARLCEPRASRGLAAVYVTSTASPPGPACPVRAPALLSAMQPLPVPQLQPLLVPGPLRGDGQPCQPRSPAPNGGSTTSYPPETARPFCKLLATAFTPAVETARCPTPLSSASVPAPLLSSHALPPASAISPRAPQLWPSDWALAAVSSRRRTTKEPKKKKKRKARETTPHCGGRGAGHAPAHATVPPAVLRWFEAGTGHILTALGRRDSAGLTPDAMLGAQRRMKELSTARDTTGISFKGGALQYKYYNTKFQVWMGVVQACASFFFPTTPPPDQSDHRGQK